VFLFPCVIVPLCPGVWGFPTKSKQEYEDFRGYVPIQFTSYNNRAGALPIRLGWSTSGHKSQGMSLTKLIVTLPRDERMKGWTLVVLSRCTSLEGIIMDRVSMERLVGTVNKMDRTELVQLYKALRARAGRCWIPMNTRVEVQG
jgi:hypothetical protein